MRVKVRDRDEFDHPQLEAVAAYIAEWRRWRSGEAGSVQARSLVWDEVKAAMLDANKGQAKPMGYVTESAERTDRALCELQQQRASQAKALVIYHTQTTSYAAIASRVNSDRNRVAELLRLAHENFIALRAYN